MKTPVDPLDDFDWSAASDVERQAWAAVSTERECVQQGVPFKIDDPVMLAVIADALTPVTATAPGRRSRAVD